MVFQQSCSSNEDWSKRKIRFQNRKLRVLTYIKDSYERKLAALEASIAKLEEQIRLSEESISA